MCSITSRLIAGLCAVALSSSAAAQSINPALDRQQGETQIVGAITVPLGSSPDERRTAPRFEIITRTDGSAASPLLARDNERQWQERRIGVTLDGSSTLMLNGQPLSRDGDKANLDTGEVALIIGGVLLAAGIYTVIALDRIASGSGGE